MKNSNLTPYAYVDACRHYLGTKFHHQGRSGTRGLDCIGMCVLAAMDLGIAHGVDRISGYGRAPRNSDFDRWAGHFSVQQPYNRLQPLAEQVRIADCVTFWIDRPGMTRHVAVITKIPETGRPHMIHSYARENRGVMEIEMTSYWTNRVTGIYRLREFCEEK